MPIIQRYNPVSGQFDFVNLGGGGSTITVVANYSALPAVGSVSGQFYWCSASQGTSWLPGSLGGTYYSAGLYYSNGVSWEFLDVSYQATQAEVNIGTNTDKFVTPDTLKNSTQFQYLDATSSIQTQLNVKASGDVSAFRKIGATTLERWYTSAITVHSITTVALTKNVLRATPFIVSVPMTFDRIGMEITGAGTAGSLVRIGIYSTPDLLPDSLVLDAGTIAGDSATFQSIIINQALPVGLYYLAFVHNSVANITFRAITANTGIPSVLGVTNNLGASNPANLISSTFVYSTLPNPFDNTAIAATGLNIATISLRRSA